jgi:hypothetical protein
MQKESIQMGIQPHLNTSHLKEVGALNQEFHERSKDRLCIRTLMFYLLPSALEPSAFLGNRFRQELKP